MTSKDSIILSPSKTLTLTRLVRIATKNYKASDGTCCATALFTSASPRWRWPWCSFSSSTGPTLTPPSTKLCTSPMGIPGRGPRLASVFRCLFPRRIWHHSASQRSSHRSFSSLSPLSSRGKASSGIRYVIIKTNVPLLSTFG